MSNKWGADGYFLTYSDTETADVPPSPYSGGGGGFKYAGGGTAFVSVPLLCDRAFKALS